MMKIEQIKKELNKLSPEIPWAHLIEFYPGLYSVSENNEKFYKKAKGLNLVGELLLKISEIQVKNHTLSGKRVIDLACGEGGHSIQFAKKGASVLGIEGRDLYVKRAKFAARAVGEDSNIEIIKGDVRKIKKTIGTFDIVIFSGILHHLGVDDFDGIIKELSRLTEDLLLIYTHISTDLSVKNHRLQGPVSTEGSYQGHLFREHKDNATGKEKEDQVRASLDNTFSFWAKEDQLVSALEDAGFPFISKVLTPHPFGWENASYRPIIIAKKK